VHSLPTPWDAHSDDEVRAELAREAVDMALQLKGTDGWRAFSEAIELEIQSLVNDLITGSTEDEQNRGAIRALRHVKSMPDNLIREASAELDRHARPTQ
jgi:hypothetical protein